MSFRTAWADPRLRAYALLRFVIGIDLLVHGGIRIWHGPSRFVTWLAGQFAGTPIPRGVVVAFGWPLAFLEFGLGALLVVGLFTREALTLAFLLIAALVFGSSVRQDWPTVGVQIIYALAYFILLTFVDRDELSIDGWRRAR
jgi:thiosulfate dehydrogenase [quinone] large subunit